MANAKKRWIIEYQQEREKKREYIRENVLALGLDEHTLLTKMQAAKDSLIPSMDDCTMAELENFVAELHHEHKLNKEEIMETIDSSAKNGENGGSGDVSDNKSSLALFDKLQSKEDQELDDSVSSVRSSNSFRSMSTRK